MFIGVSLALVQTDIKRMLAYHTISQVGYVLMGIGLGSYIGISGALYHFANHAIFKALMFLAAGAVLHQTGTRDLNRLGGLARNMPLTTIAFTAGALAISGVPPFNGFASKWMLYNASFEVNPLITAVALLASAITLGSFLKIFHTAFLGTRPKEFEGVKEAPLFMTLPMLAFALACLLMGLFPDQVLQYLVFPATDALASPAAYASGVLPGFPVGEPQFATPLFAYAGYWDALAWSALFALAAGAAWLGLGFVRAALGAGGGSREAKSFICGEEGGEYPTPATGIYSAFKEALNPFFAAIVGYQSGVVSDYAAYVVSFAAILAAAASLGLFGLLL
jgi:multicomponent Na+:H+ antiporter subunit D